MTRNRIAEIDNELRILDRELSRDFPRAINSPLGSGLESSSSYAKYLRRERRRLRSERRSLSSV